MGCCGATEPDWSVCLFVREGRRLWRPFFCYGLTNPFEDIRWDTVDFANTVGLFDLVGSDVCSWYEVDGFVEFEAISVLGKTYLPSVTSFEDYTIFMYGVEINNC